MRALLPLALLTTGACATVDAARLATLEAQVRRQADIEEIRALLHDYGRLLDAQDFDGFGALFARDGEWAGGGGATVGPEAIAATMRAAFGPGSGVVWTSDFHLLGNEIITVDGDEGRAISRWMFVRPGADGGPSLVLAGRYRDELVREDGVWRFKRRELVNDMALEGFLSPPSTDE